MLTETEKAYIAGIIDGEGAIFITKQSQRQFSPRIKIANTNKNIIDFLHEKIPKSSKVFLRKRNNSKHKPVWEFSIRSFKVIEELLKQVSPYLIIKTKQAELILKFIEQRKEELEARPRNQKGQYIKKNRDWYTENDLQIIEQVKNLNKRGI